jgi:hypothetical protein
MKQRDQPWRGLKPWHRLVLGFFGLTIVGTSVLVLWQGKFFYGNTQGTWELGPAFAPFAIIVGGGLVVLAFRSGPQP